MVSKCEGKRAPLLRHQSFAPSAVTSLVTHACSLASPCGYSGSKWHAPDVCHFERLSLLGVHAQVRSEVLELVLVGAKDDCKRQIRAGGVHSAHRELRAVEAPRAVWSMVCSKVAHSRA
jgi:hypothetical protein